MSIPTVGKEVYQPYAWGRVRTMRALPENRAQSRPQHTMPLLDETPEQWPFIFRTLFSHKHCQLRSISNSRCPSEALDFGRVPLYAEMLLSK